MDEVLFGADFFKQNINEAEFRKEYNKKYQRDVDFTEFDAATV